MVDTIFRIHPAIGIGRVGNSEDYYLAPETPAAYPSNNGSPQTGGLPIKAGTESETITDADIRDASGGFKKQAARFRIYQYPAGPQSYPTGDGTEIIVGSKVGDKTVKDIIWTVHLANKKANCYTMPEPDTAGEQLIDFYKYCKTPPLLRNTQKEQEATPKDDEAAENPCCKQVEGFSDDPNDVNRRIKLQIDPGPRAIRASDPADTSVEFDLETVASFWDARDGVSENPDYPQSFPCMHFPDLSCPVEAMPTLGRLRTEPNGRLLVIPANGFACSFSPHCELYGPVDNSCWFDDVADGPVSATIVFDDGSTQEAQSGWVVTTDPGYAPQTLNVVSLWDDIYNTFVEKLGLNPHLYDDGAYKTDFKPSFDDDIHPIFLAAFMQQWNTALPDSAIAGHEKVLSIDSSQQDPAILSYLKSIVRDPNKWKEESEIGAPRMPLSLGDIGMSFLMVSKTQYFYLTQWFDNKYSKGPEPALGPGEYLDKATFINCLGGRYSPGIDMTFIVRVPELWKQNWQNEGTFRINAQKLDYSTATKDTPFLTAGWFPLRGEGCPPFSEGVEPGDTSKFMALPWHTDYNSCATHTPAPNPAQNLTLFWSWPAQRPVSVYVASDVKDGKLGDQRFSIRGKGTETDLSAEVGRYQDRINIVKNWHKIGVVMQSTAIKNEGLPEDMTDVYLEVKSTLGDSGNAVIPWPNTIRDRTKPAEE